MGYFRFKTREDAQVVVDKINSSEGVIYCLVELDNEFLSDEHYKTIGYKVINDKVTEKYI